MFELDFSVIPANSSLLWEGIKMTFLLAGLAIIGGIILGTFLAIVISIPIALFSARNLAPNYFVYILSKTIIIFFRADSDSALKRKPVFSFLINSCIPPTSLAMTNFLYAIASRGFKGVTEFVSKLLILGLTTISTLLYT